MGLLKKLGIGAGVALGCLVLAVLVLTQLAVRREAQVEPLSIEELRRLMAKGGSDPSDSGMANRQDEVPAEVARGTIRPPMAPRSPGTLRLTSLPTPDQTARKFGAYTGQGPKAIAHKAGALVGKSIQFALYSLRGNVDQYGSPATMRLALSSVEAGNLDSARSWLREGIRTESKDGLRRMRAEMLAWIETDPEVATALLEESCSGPWGDEAAPYPEWVAPVHALDFCIVTGNEDLAEYYYLGCRDSSEEWLPLLGTGEPFFRERLGWVQDYVARTASKDDDAESTGNRKDVR